VANCAHSLSQLMSANLDVYKEFGVPICARRLKTLLNYFHWVLNYYEYVTWDW
jgi:hypothetical protein